MNIKQASKQSGVSAPNIRFYEKEGLLDLPGCPATITATTQNRISAPSGSSGCCGCWMCRFRSSDPCLQAMHRWGVSCGSKRPHWNSAQSSWKGRRVFVQNWPGRTVCGITGCGRLPVPDGGPCAAAELFLRLGAGLPHAGTGAAPEAFFLYSGGQHQHPAGVHSGPADLRKGQRDAAQPDKRRNVPEFSLDGISYKAYRNPGKYRDEICCDAASPEQLNTGLPSRRERQLQVLRILLPAAFTFAAILAAGWVATGGADWLWLAALAAAGVLLGRCFEHRL